MTEDRLDQDLAIRELVERAGAYAHDQRRRTTGERTFVRGNEHPPPVLRASGSIAGKKP
ncbi:hypothetical protein WMF27_29715 [Sorangium sp. So ce281]|uniref:hypothetical protein n=1 Tax=unclassified Sorangium TaxID=2621164 RepID=UPI003F5FDE0A